MLNVNFVNKKDIVCFSCFMWNGWFQTVLLLWLAERDA